MAKTIGQLTAVTTFNPSTDEFVIEQSGQTFKVAASVVRGGLVNANIDAAAAIVYSKLNLANSIVAGDITSAAVTPAKLSQPYTLATAQNSTSGTSIDFTGIPSWAKRITVMLNGVSTNGTSQLLVQIGDSGGYETTGYESAAACGVTGSTFGISANGFLVEPLANLSAATLRFGSMIISTLGSNIWVEQLGVYTTTLGTEVNGAGGKTLSDTLTQVRVTTVSGTDTFDAGSINISYEG